MLSDVCRSKSRNAVLNIILGWLDNYPNTNTLTQISVTPYCPLLRNPPNPRLPIQLRRLLPRRPQFPVGQHATGEQVVHQAGFDLLVFFDQGFGFFDGQIQRCQNRCNLRLFFITYRAKNLDRLDIAPRTARHFRAFLCPDCSREHSVRLGNVTSKSRMHIFSHPEHKNICRTIATELCANTFSKSWPQLPEKYIPRFKYGV